MIVLIPDLCILTYFRNSDLKICIIPTKYQQFSTLNGQLSLDRLNINQRSKDNLIIQYFEDDCLWKVSLKILNSGIILKI